MPEPQIQFCTSADGTRIAYTVFGSGPPLVQVPRWAHCIEWMTREPEIGRFYEKLAERNTVVIVERRGTGASQRDVEDFALERHVEDLAAVVDKLGLERFALFGAGDSGAVCLSYALQHPERVKRLVIWGGYVRGQYWAEKFRPLDVDGLRTFVDHFRYNWAGAARLTAANVYPTGPLDAQLRAAELWQKWVSPDVAHKYVLFTWSFNLLDELAQVTVPTLALHRREIVGQHGREASEEIAAGVQHGLFAEVDGNCLIAEFDHEQVLAHMLPFLAEDAPPAAPSPSAIEPTPSIAASGAPPGIRYARTKDGVNIAYATLGQGMPCVWIPGFADTVEGLWASGQNRLIRRYAEDFRVVWYDRAGLGLSDSHKRDSSLAGRLAELEAVVDALHLDRFILRAMSDGCLTALAYAAAHPDKVEKLILFGAFASYKALGESRSGLTEGIVSLVQSQPAAAEAVLAALPGGNPGVFDFNESWREHTIDVMETGRSIDVTDLLPRVTSPTLLIHGRDDKMVPLQFGRELAGLLPDATLFVYDGDHYPRNPQVVTDVNRAIREFLGLQRSEWSAVPPEPPAATTPAAATQDAPPDIRYARTTDGVNIAYCVEGQGYPLVLAPGWINPIEFSWQYRPSWASFAEYAQHFQLIRFDRRGVGFSDRGIKDFSVEARVRDLEAVVDALDLERFALYGASESGPMVMQYAARSPDRVSHLVLHGTYASGAKAFDEEISKAVVALMRAQWGLASATVTEAFFGADVDQETRKWFTDIQRKGANSQDAAGITEAIRLIDVRPMLSSIRAPTLVIHGTEDALSNVENGRELAAGISGARLLTYLGMHYLGETPAEIGVLKEVIEFISGRPLTKELLSGSAAPALQQQTSHGTAIILFADIVDSTGLTERIGDTSFRDKARVLEQTLRRVIESAGGTAIGGRTLGDGVLATFPAARQAIEAALRCASAGDDAGLPLHLGLHAGDILREGLDIYGGAVNIAARISGLTGPGEVLVSDIVRGLARTSADVAFEDRGEHALKGVSDDVRVYEVRPKTSERSTLPDGLTTREVEVLRLIAAGRTNTEIATELTLSVRTVARHITNIYTKIGARNKAEATDYVHRSKLT